MQKHNLSVIIDPQNLGVLIVELEGGTEQVMNRGGVMPGADDITRWLDWKDEGLSCNLEYLLDALLACTVLMVTTTI